MMRIIVGLVLNSYYLKKKEKKMMCFTELIDTGQNQCPTKQGPNSKFLGWI